MDIYRFYSLNSHGSNKMGIIRDEFESRVKEKACSRFMCVKGEKSVSAFNDAGSIRLTFNNGAVLVSSNSEWGGITIT